MRRVCSAAVVLGCVLLAQAVENPFKVCSRDDPDLNDCLKDAIQAGLVAIASGVPGLKISPLDPYLEKELTIEYKQNQIAAKSWLKNIRAFGLSQAKVLDVRANIQEDIFELEVDMTNKQVFIEGDFKAEGRLNALAFDTKGYFNNTMSDLTWTWKLAGLPEVKKNQTFLRITKFFMRPEVGNMKVHLPKTFPDNDELSQIALDFANNYWRVIYKELLPVVELTWSKLGIKESNRIFLKIPYDEMFPASQ